MEEPREIFNLMTRLSSANHDCENAAKTAYEDIIYYVNNELSDLIDSSSFPQKSSIKEQLDAVLERAHLFVRYPFLYGKTAVSIWVGKTPESRKFIHQLQDGHSFYPSEGQRNCPYIIYHDNINNHIFASNQASNIIQLSIQEYEIAMKQLHLLGIDIKDLVKSFSFSASLKHKLINFIVLPRYANVKAAEFNHMADLCDAFFIVHEETIDYNRLPDAIICSNFPLYLIARPNDLSAQEAFNHLKKNYPHRDIHLTSPEEAMAVCDSYNRVQRNFYLYDQLLEILLQLKIHQYDKLKKHEENAELLSRGTYDAEDVRDIISTLRKTEFESKDFESNMTQRIEGGIQKLLELVTCFDNAIRTFAPSDLLDQVSNPDVISLPLNDKTEANIVFGALQCKDITLADKYLKKMQLRNEPLTYIYQMYRNEVKEAGSFVLLPSAKEKLLNITSPNNPVVIRAKIHFAEKLQIATSVRDELACCLPRHTRNSDELYYAACHVERVNGVQQAYDFYEEAFRKGNVQAGERLVDYYLKNNDKYGLKKLADALIPKAAFEYGKLCLQNNKYAQGITYLRIAVVLQYTPAVLFYSDYLYNRAVENQESKDIDTAIFLFSHINKNKSSKDNTTAKLGVLYYLKGSFYGAKQCFEKNHSLPEASYYYGCMYHYGQSVSKDCVLAERYLLEAKEQGYYSANILLAQIQMERTIKQNTTHSRRDNQKNSASKKQSNSYSSYNQEKNYSTTTSRGSSSDEGCFITTATCKSEGKPDDCDELTAFRKYRDEELCTTPEGQALIAEYYRVAPGIVEKISQEPNADEIYRFLYNKYIRPGYILLQQGKGDEAKRLYAEGVAMLANKYGIKLTSTISVDA